MVKNPAAHHAISAKFDKAVDNKGKALVVQYEVKLQSATHPSPFPMTTFTDVCPKMDSNVAAPT